MNGRPETSRRPRTTKTVSVNISDYASADTHSAVNSLVAPTVIADASRAGHIFEKTVHRPTANCLSSGRE
jgi:hypothetical protein